MMDLQEVGYQGMVRIEVAQDRNRCRALVNAVMNYGFHKIRRISWLAENWLVSLEILCFME